MGGISDEHVEWAVVNRLKAMLDDPPATPFNVTQSFAHFTTILLWTKNRMWVAGNAGDRIEWADPADGLAHGARERLREKIIFDDPWCLSTRLPRLAEAGAEGLDGRINSDFEGMTAEAFFKWLRDALAHGDGRTIRPVHKQSFRDGKTWLAGFEIEFEEYRKAPRMLTLTLHHEDIKRLGRLLADEFCRSLSGGDQYFEEEAGTAAILEAGTSRAA
jgi:hypothetical protein